MCKVTEVSSHILEMIYLSSKLFGPRYHNCSKLLVHRPDVYMFIR